MVGIIFLVSGCSSAPSKSAPATPVPASFKPTAPSDFQTLHFANKDKALDIQVNFIKIPQKGSIADKIRSLSSEGLPPQNYYAALKDKLTRANTEPVDGGLRQWYYVSTLEGYEVDSPTAALQGSWFVLKLSKDTYTGGANGSQGETYWVINMSNLKVLSLSSLLDPNDAAFRQIVDAALKARPNTHLLDEEPSMAESFYLTNEGLGLHWDPAIITPHVDGSINIIIPWNKLDSVLGPALK
jgi:hypothetical protein